KSDTGLQQPLTIFIRKGTYYLAEPLTLTGEDSGTRQCPITYKAYGNEKPVLCGGKMVAGWKPYKGRIVQCLLSEAKADKLKFRQLFFDGRRQIRARWPNRVANDPLYGGWAFIEAILPEGEKRPTEFRFAAPSPARPWSKPHLAEVNIFPWYCWVNDIIPVKKVDADRKTITLARQAFVGWMPLMPGNRFRVENVLEELDQPGEWCLDSDTGTVYFWPPAATLEDGQVIVPVTDTLIELRGTPDAPIRYVSISGLTFTQTRSPFPEQQSSNFHSPLLRGAAVHLENCRHCRVEDNLLHNLGGDAVRLQGPNTENRIVGNEIAHIGGAGVSLASSAPGNTHTWADRDVLRKNSRRYPKMIRNVISNNHIHHGGIIKKNGGAIHIYGINSVDNVVSHNLIHHISDKGMTMQDGFGRAIVEYNEMYQLGQEIADTGGIMTNRWFVLKDDPELAKGNIFRFNLIRDCIGCGAYAEKRHPKGEGDSTTAGGRIWTPYYTWGIYLDNSGEDVTIYGNIVISAVLGGVAMPVASARNNRVENNIFVNCSGNQMDLRMAGGALGNRFLRNIIYYK
ncbi:MAG: right-handed parallel beta-helix repeat-containing protein, partial [Chloroflexota bacterium]|nr:right-handed parallel beta-helix repeat-containing protein [Chloroflexota bacterium]